MESPLKQLGSEGGYRCAKRLSKGFGEDRKQSCGKILNSNFKKQRVPIVRHYAATMPRRRRCQANAQPARLLTAFLQVCLCVRAASEGQVCPDAAALAPLASTIPDPGCDYEDCAGGDGELLACYAQSHESCQMANSDSAFKIGTGHAGNVVPFCHQCYKEWEEDGGWRCRARKPRRSVHWLQSRPSRRGA